MTTLKFGTDGWRGVMGEDCTFDHVHKVTQAIARYIVRAANADQGVVVGYDTRLDSENFARAAAETLSAAGIPVWLASEACPTPATSLLVRQRGAAGGIQITASHNPYCWNGIKFKASYGGSASPAIVAQIEVELAKVLGGGAAPLPARPKLIQALEVRTPYLETIEKLVDWERLRASKLRFLIDPIHGAGRGLLKELFARQGVEADEIRGARDPRFGGVNPEPIEPHVEALRQGLRGGDYDAGFAFDGDADRLGAMDSLGNFVTPHQIFSILFWHLAGTRELAGDVAKSFSTTNMIDGIAARFGRKVWETAIGFKYICDRMLESDVLIGGEESGGIATRLYLPERDATVNALLLAEVMAWHGMRLDELVAMLQREFGEYHYGRMDLTLKPGQAERALKHFAGAKVARVLKSKIERRENRDGLKLCLGDAGWVLLRKSGTERLLRIYAETPRAETTQQTLEEVAAVVRAI